MTAGNQGTEETKFGARETSLYADEEGDESKTVCRL